MPDSDLRFRCRETTIGTHDWISAAPPLIIRPVENGGVMDTYGFELAATYEVNES
jgi:hypothetical protein